MEPVMHVISNGKQELGQWLDTCRRIDPWTAVFHLREKQRTVSVIETWINAYLEAGLPLGKLRLNDRVETAYQTGVRQVQLPQNGLSVSTVKRRFPEMHAAVSVHSLEEAKRAEAAGADELMFGHVFMSSSKPGIVNRGVHQLADIVERVAVPVTALGGITPHNVFELRKAGAAAPAVMSGLMEAADPEKTAQDYCERWENG